MKTSRMLKAVGSLLAVGLLSATLVVAETAARLAMTIKFKPM